MLPLIDLSKLSDEEIVGEPVLRSTLGLLKYSRSKQLAEKLGELLRLIQGREEGLERGKLTGKIQLIQELLGDNPTPESELNECAIDILTTKLVELQQRIRDRNV